MTAITQALSAALIHFVWQGSIVGFLLWATLFTLRRRSANARYAAGCAALAILALLPIITTAVLYVRAVPAGPGANAVAVISQTVTAAWSGPGSETVNWLRRLQWWTLPVWSLGVILFSVRLVWGCRHAFVLGRRGKPAGESVVAIVAGLAKRMGVDRPVRVLISTMAEVPGVVGWLRPVILLPAATFLALTPEQLEAVLAHEFAHIRRYDYLVNIFQMLAETLFFYHPAVWWTSKRIRVERELCCDDLAVRSCGDALGYARALTTLEKMRLTAPGMAMGSTNGPLLYRVQRLMGVAAEEYRPSRLSAVVAIGLGLACVALNVNWVRAQARTVASHEEPRAQTAPDSLGVRVDLGASSVIHRTAVEYPEAARKQGVKGTVQVEVRLDADGNVADARVLSGPEELRNAALRSVLSWHFTHDAARSTRQISMAFEPPPPGTEAKSVFLVLDDAKVALQNKELVVRKVIVRAGEGQEPQPPQGDGKFLSDSQRSEESDRANLEALKVEEQLKAQIESLRQQRALAFQTGPKTNVADLTLKLQLAERELEARARGQNGAGGRGLLPQRQELAAQEASVNLIRRRELERQMADLKKQAAMASQTGDQSAVADLNVVLKLLQAEFQATSLPGRQSPIAERTLKNIVISGIPDAAGKELLSRLPVHDGDMLSRESIEAIAQAVRDFDEHLGVSFLRTDDGQVQLRITVAR